MYAILPEKEICNAMQPDNKEMINCYNVIVSTKKGLHNALTVRFYMGRSNQASTVYCCLWLHGKKYLSGKGNAGGYGYHKKSAALQSAIMSAGIDLHGDNYGEKTSSRKRAYIGGCGEGSMEAAMLAIVRAAGYKGRAIIVRN